MSPLIKVNDWSREDAKRELLLFWKEMSPVVVRAVEASFAKAGMRNPVYTEVKRRTLMAKNLVSEMRLDLKWSKQRCADVLPLALDAKLAGLEFDLEALGKRATW